MNGFGNWIRQFLMKLSMAFRQFMVGRYGTDKLNSVILTAGLIVCLVGVFVGGAFSGLFTIVSYSLMFWALFRTFSRNTYKRYQENRKFLIFLERIKDREHRYFSCPKCKQTVRVPRGKGKLAITCPRCKERFIKKS
jgi:hypothetical protein